MRRKIFTQVLVGLEWAIVTPVDGPDQHATDAEALHLLSDLLSCKMDLVHFARESSHLVKGSFVTLKTHIG